MIGDLVCLCAQYHARRQLRAQMTCMQKSHRLGVAGASFLGLTCGIALFLLVPSQSLNVETPGEPDSFERTEQ